MFKLPYNCAYLIYMCGNAQLEFTARLQQYVNRDLPDVQAGFRKGREKRLNCQHQLGQI